MAKKVKKPISKPKKKGSSKKKKSGNIFTKILVIIIVLVLVAFFAFRFIGGIKNSAQITDNHNIDKKEVVKKEKVDKKEKTSKKELKETTKIVERNISGSWMSSSEGAILIMKDHDYRIDFMGVDSDAPIIGSYSVEGDIITFVNKKDPCIDAKGLYEVSYKDKEISFKCKSDNCLQRKSALTTEWEWIDIDE